jgi:hypothetical protein
MTQVTHIGKAEAEQRLKDRLAEEEEARLAQAKAEKIRKTALKLATDYHAKTRYTLDPARLTEAARQFLSFMDEGDFEAREAALGMAVNHMKGGKHNRTPQDVTSLADAFYQFLVSEDD